MDQTASSFSRDLLAKHVAIGAVLVLAAIIVQWPALPGTFIWDDYVMLPLNPQLRGPSGLWYFWTSTSQPDYWPVSYSTHWLEWRLWGTWVSPYRAANLALHALNAILAWRILTRLGVAGAWWCALAFAVHPVNVEAVAWILQRKTVLSTALAAGCLWCFLESDARPGRRYYVAAIVLFALAMLAKTSVVMWPLVLLLCRWWQRRRLAASDLRAIEPFLVIALVLGLIAVAFQQYRAIGDDVVRDDGLVSRVALAGWTVWFYLAKAVFPAQLCFMYPRWPLGIYALGDFIPLVSIGAALAIFWWQRSRLWGAACLAGFGYYLLNLVPVLGFVNIYFMRYSLVADHWQYLALPGLIALVVGSGAYWMERSGSVARVAWHVLLLGAAIALGAKAYSHAAIFGGATNEPLWNDTLAKNPCAWVAHNALGFLLITQHKYEPAIEHFQAAILLEPDYAPAHDNWGVALCRLGRIEAGIAHYRRALEIDSRFANSHHNLGVALEAQGSLDEAIASYRRAIELRPGSASSHLALGGALLRHHQPGAAIEHFSKVIRLEPGNAAAYSNLGVACAAKGRFNEAVRAVSIALRLSEGRAPAQQIEELKTRLKQYAIARESFAP